MDKRLILDPSEDLSIDCYPDADFAGFWSHKHPQDPHRVQSHTCYVITLAGYPVLWQSKFQTEISLSTMESEYVALTTSCKDSLTVTAKSASSTKAVTSSGGKEHGTDAG